MDLTLHEAASQLGKSLRQVRYMIKRGKLPAKKVGAAWRIDSTALPRSPGQVEAAAHKDQQLRAAVEQALDGKDQPQGRRYSMRNLRAVQVGLPIQRACEASLGKEHPSTQALYAALEHLARGCHRFARAEKLEAYRSARDEASRCACALAVAGTDGALLLLDRVEQELLPAIAGLLRRHERRDRA